jgi:L-arabinose transport system substrate-binding protein
MNRTIRRHTLRALLAALCIAPLGMQGAATPTRR